MFMRHASAKSKRGLIFLPCFTHGGAEKQGALLARYLQSSGYEVEVWGFPSPTSGAPLKRQLDCWKIAHRELPHWPSLDWSFSRDRLSIRRFYRQYLTWPRQIALFESRLPPITFDVVVPFTFWPCLAASLMQRNLMARKVVWNHRGGFDDAGISYTPFLVEQVLRQRPVFVANSTAGGQFLQHAFSVEADQVHIIHNAHVPEEGEDEPGIDANRPDHAVINLLHLANIFPEKDIETLLDAIRSLKSSGVKCLLHLVGSFLDEKYKNTIEKKVAALDILDYMRFHGNVDRGGVHLLLREADIGLLSSRSEGMPNSVMEYMYRGLPVVATDIPGVREVVGNENAQWLFPVGDASSLQRLITRLARNSALRRKLGIANRQRIINEFDVNKIMPQWLKLLDAL